MIGSLKHHAAAISKIAAFNNPSPGESRGSVDLEVWPRQVHASRSIPFAKSARSVGAFPHAVSFSASGVSNETSKIS
jgi:hypothetical protein